MNVPIGVNRDHPEAAISRDKIHCGQYLKNQSRKHLAGEVLDFLKQEPSSSTRVASTHLNIYHACWYHYKKNIMKRKMETLQLKILNRSIF